MPHMCVIIWHSVHLFGPSRVAKREFFTKCKEAKVKVSIRELIVDAAARDWNIIYMEGACAHAMEA